MRVHAAVLIATGLAVGWPVQAYAYKPARARLIPLTDVMIRKVAACYRAVDEAEERATGGRSEVYKNRARLRDAALRRCGFPKGVTWRDAAYSARIAFLDLGQEQALEEPRSANRKLAVPLRAQLSAVFSE